MAPRAGFRGLRYTRLPLGPYAGMLDADAPQAGRRQAARLLQNMYPADADLGGPATIGRPGFKAMGGQLGSVGARTGQRMVQYTKLDGTERTVGLCGGKFYTYTWATDVWTEVLTAADFTAASITVSPTAKVYAVTFNDLLIVSDGVNLPWAWNGTTNGGLTKLTNAAVFYGQPWVYYNKLFGIKNAERTTVVWSEEAAPNTGYEAGGFNNAWQLRQTGQEPFVAGVGTNEAIYLWRPNSITLVRGEVTTNFSSTGTREGVSDSEGTSSPAGVLQTDSGLYFISTSRRFYRIVGGGLQEVGQGLRRTLGQVPQNQLATVVAAADPGRRLLSWGVPDANQTTPTIVLSLHRDSGAAACKDTGFAHTTLDLVTNDSATRVLAHFGGASATGAADGRAYVHGLPTGTTWDDGFTDSAAPIQHVWEGHEVGYNEVLEKQFSRLDLSVRLPTALTAVSVSYTTPRSQGTAQVLASGGLGGATWDSAVWDTDVWAAEGGERRLGVGLAAEGRWLRPRVSHAVLGERWELMQASLELAPLDERATIV